MKYTTQIVSFWALIIVSLVACTDRDVDQDLPLLDEWIRETSNPVLRDVYPSGVYESASDGNVFNTQEGDYAMIYSGDVEDKSAIKLARGSSLTDWTVDQPLLYLPNGDGTDAYKETAFYRLSPSGKHQIYYIGYPDEASYESQVFLAESDALEGPYEQMSTPLMPTGLLAGQEVYCITSPSVMEYMDTLFMAFLGWNAHPSEVTEVYTLGAYSTDDGYTWSEAQQVNCPIGMEGQVTRATDGSYVAVSTRAFGDGEAIFYATSDHPFGPWTDLPEPILSKAGAPLEVDEVIAPSIFIDPSSGREVLFYTGADYSTGWWMMAAYPR